jgi:hypothetical protein
MTFTDQNLKTAGHVMSKQGTITTFQLDGPQKPFMDMTAQSGEERTLLQRGHLASVPLPVGQAANRRRNRA